MSTRTVTGTVYGLGETPLEGKRVKFNLLQLGAATDSPVFPKQENPDPIFTDANGEFSIDLWVNESPESEIESIYEVVFHDDTRAQFIIPAGGGSIDISDLIINHNPSASASQSSSALALKADRDAGNLTVDNESDWRLKLSLVVGTNVQAHSAVLDATQASYTTAEEAKLASIEAGAEANDPATLLSGDLGVTVQAHSAVLDATQASYTTAEEAKLASVEAGAEANDPTTLLAADIGLSVQAHDAILDTIETTITNNDLAVPTSGAVVDHVSSAIALGSQGSPGKQVIKSVTFPTNSDFLSVADDATLDVGTGDFSIFFKARIDSGSSVESIIYKYGSGQGYQVRFASGTLQLVMDDGAEDIFSLATGLSDDQWHEYVITVDRDDVATAYVDNIAQGPVNVTSAAGSVNNTGQLQIGLNGSSNPLNNGAMASYVGLAKDLITAAEIEDSTFDPTRLKDLSDLSLCVDLSNSSKDDIKDRSSNDHTVLANGTITYNDDRLPVDVARVSEIFITDESQLDGTLLSDKVYVVDPSLVMTGAVTITVPATGLAIRSTGAITSSITCSADNYTMFDGGGTLVVEGISFTISGLNSKVFGCTGPNAIDIASISRCAFVGCTAIGELTDYAIIQMDTNQEIANTQGWTISGDVIEFDRKDCSSTSNLPNCVIFAEGTNLLFSRRATIKDCTDTIDATVILCNFKPANFDMDGGFQVSDNDIVGTGDFFSEIDGDDVKCYWSNNSFDPPSSETNTYIGARWELTTEVETVVSASVTDYKVLGTTTYSDEFWFSNTTNNAIVYDSTRSINVVIQGALSITGINGHDIQLKLRKWDDSEASYVDIQTIPKREMSSTGAAAAIPVLAYTILDSPDDRIELWGQNVGATGNFTLKQFSVLTVAER